MSVILRREIHLLVVVGIASTRQRLYCWDKAAVPLLYNRSTIKTQKKKIKRGKRKRMNHILKALIAVVSAGTKPEDGGERRPRGGGGRRRAVTRAGDAPRQLPPPPPTPGGICSVEPTAVKTRRDVSDTQWHADTRQQGRTATGQTFMARRPLKTRTIKLKKKKKRKERKSCTPAFKKMTCYPDWCN